MITFSLINGNLILRVNQANHQFGQLQPELGDGLATDLSLMFQMLSGKV